MDKHPGKRSFGGAGKFGGPRKFGGPKKFGSAGGFRKGPGGASRPPFKRGGPRPEDGVKPEGRVGGEWRAPGISSPSAPIKRRGDFRPAPREGGYSSSAPRPYSPRPYGQNRPEGGYAPRPFNREGGDRPAPRPFDRDSRPAREGYAPRPYSPRPFTPRPYGQNRPEGGYAPRPFNREGGDRPAPRFNRDGDRAPRPFDRGARPESPRRFDGPRRDAEPRQYGDRPARSFDRREAPVAPTRAPEKTSWGVSAEWYDGAVEAEGSYQKELILPNLVRLMAVEKDEKVADIACGQGFFARELAKAGAKVTGVDISPELVEIAAARGEGAATFAVAAAHETGLSKSGFDQAIIVLALQNIREMAETLAEAARVLKKGGALHIVLNHPCFRIPKKSSWGFDQEANIQFRRLDAYLTDAAARMEMHPGAAPEVATVSFHRPLQAYFKALEKAGFTVARLEEWSSHKTSQPGARAEAENVARREFPLFMYVRAEKR